MIREDPGRAFHLDKVVNRSGYGRPPAYRGILSLRLGEQLKFKMKFYRFLMVMGNIPIVYQKKRKDVGPKSGKVKKVLVRCYLTVKLAKIWVETINCGVTIGEFSACWTY
jgi:hypothetical protein